MDFLLALLIITGLSVSTIVVSLFGPTRELVASLRLGACGEFRRQRTAASRSRQLRTATPRPKTRSAMFETSPDLSVNTVAEIVRLALAPVFLLSGIGAFLNVLASRLSRIVDRSRQVEPTVARQPRRGA